MLTGSIPAADAFGQDPAPASPQPEQPVLSDIRIVGASIYSAEELQRRHGLAAGTRLDEPPETVADRIRKYYASNGYSFATVTATLDEAKVLTVEIDEGQVNAIEFHGVSDDI